MTLKTLFSPLLQDLAHVSGTSTVRAWRQRVGRIVMFHGIDDVDYPLTTFESQLAYLARTFSVVPLSTIVERLANPAEEPPANQIAVTFDDGLRNNYTVAYPVLRRLGIPATFFVCPRLIDRQEWLWTHEVAARLRVLTGVQRAVLAQDVGAPVADVSGFKEWMKTLPAGACGAAQRNLRQLTPEFTPTEEQRARFDLMTWDDLRALDPRVVTVGSHSATHPVLTSLDPGAAAVEVGESRRWLEEGLGRPVEYFCYPNGAFDDSIVEMVRSSYRAAVTAEPGFVRTGDDLFRLKRVPATQRPTLMTWRLHRPGA